MTDQERQAPTGATAEGERPMVVGIGASAGGLAALHSFFSGLPEKSGLAYVVVVHLSPAHESRLAEILQGQLPIPVRQVTDTTRLQPDCIYVIPPNRNLSAIDTHLRLTDLEEQRAQRAPIDHFLRTLSQTHDGNSAAVILSGTGSDGALGVKAIKEKGGLTVVQDPNEAEFDGMPQNAIATGLVDLVLPVGQILGAVLRYARTRPRLARADNGELALEERQLLHKIFAQLRAHTGRDFTSYKRSTLLRRIQRRMQMRQVEELARYLELLREDPREVHALGDDFLITVTNFFRDRAVYESLERQIVPQLFDGKGPEDFIRIWSVGCATGEEAYSLAMLMVEEAGRRDAPPRLQIFASDLHERSLARAREGFYPGDIEVDVSEERIRRFFHREDGGYRIRKEVREMIVFAPHNLLGDPPFSRLDLIACRNVLIYLQRSAQNDVLDLFHYALKPDGFLVLGDAETVDGLDLFHATHPGHCVYQKRNVQAPEPRLPVFLATPRIVYPGGGDRPAVLKPAPADVLHQRMVERYTPPSVLVSPDDKVVHLSEHAGRYLVPPGGEATLNLFRLAREELRLELRAGLHAVRTVGEPVRTGPVAVRIEGGERLVTLDVRPSLEPDHRGYALVIFDEQGRPPEGEESPEEAPAAHGRGDTESETAAELALTRRRLQAIIEQYEAGQEEMRASNEELQSANEELRSTLEELETGREELQSMNEELQTVNQENRHKVEELAQISADLHNLLASTEIATLFLDRELRILRFTPRVAELFNVRPADRGRPISDLTHRLGYPELRDDARGVLDRLIPVEREVADEAGEWYLVRVNPYRSADDRIEGVVITFVVITAMKRIEATLREREERYRVLIENAREYAILMLDPEGRITSWSAGAQRHFGYSEQEVTGRTFEFLFTEEDQAAGVPAEELRTAAETGSASDDRWQRRRGGTQFWATGATEAFRDEAGELRGFTKVLRDNTARKESEEEIRLLNQTLEQRVEERTAALEREIQERVQLEGTRREILRQLVGAEEAERGRISRELHDQMGQQVTGLLLALRALRGEAGASGAEARLGELEGLAAGIARDMQHLALQLRPPALDSLGLVAALQSHLEEWGERHGVEYDFHASGLHGVRLSPEIETTLYRVAQEALTNVLKHAGATRVSLVLERRDGAVTAIVEDDGRGFEVEPTLADPHKARRLGLRGMRERVALLSGELVIESAPDTGTSLFVRIPVAEEG